MAALALPIVFAIVLCGSFTRSAAHCPANAPADPGQILACNTETDASNYLLQSSAHRVAAVSSDALRYEDSSELPAPVPLEKPIWVHTPKTGSSFETVLAHYVCGDAIPANVSVRAPDSFFEIFGEQCPRSKFGRFENMHSPLLPSMPLQSVVIMVREPRSRAKSGYDYGMVLCYEMELRYNCPKSWVQTQACTGDVFIKGNWVRNASVIDPVEYATCWENCTANLLTGDKCSSSIDDQGPRPPTTPERVEAAVRMVDKLGFVGLTEEYNMSVCLFHAKFGGPILASELLNVRPGVADRVGDDPLAQELFSQAKDMLKSWPATSETRIYEVATARFWREVKRYKLDRESCRKKIDDAFRANPSIAEPLGEPPELFPQPSH